MLDAGDWIASVRLTNPTRGPPHASDHAVQHQHTSPHDSRSAVGAIGLPKDGGCADAVRKSSVWVFADGCE